MDNNEEREFHIHVQFCFFSQIMTMRGELNIPPFVSCTKLDNDDGGQA
jgi:hypothetical protein